jgi:hypothetical protein
MRIFFLHAAGETKMPNNPNNQTIVSSNIHHIIAKDQHDAPVSIKNVNKISLKYFLYSKKYN